MSQEDTQFKSGHEGGPGRPKGSRNKLSKRFLSVLAKDFKEHGEAAVEEVRKTKPEAYLQVIGRLMPKLMELAGPEGKPLDTNWNINIIKPSEKPPSDPSDPS